MLSRPRTQCVFLCLLWIVSSVSASIDYYAVFLEGKKIGHAIEERVEEGSEVHSSDKMHMSISRMGRPITVDAHETAVETVDGKPLSFSMEQKMSIMTTSVSGTVKDGVVDIVSQSMGAEQKKQMPWPEGAVMMEGLRLLTLKKGLKPGTSYTASVFTASLMQAMDMQITIGPKRDIDLMGRIVPLTEVKTSYALSGAGQMTQTSYVDEEGRSLKSVIPIMGLQIEMIACAKEFALSEAESPELFSTMLLTSPTPLGDLSKTEAVTYYLTPNKPGSDLGIPQTEAQSVRTLADGSVVVTVTPNAVPAGGRFPYQGDDAKAKAALEANMYLQSEDPKVVALAHEAIGPTTDTGQAVKKIEAFVAEYIETKDLSVGYASAAEVIETRQGDCSEHAVLCAALCRALGIPAQVAVGVAYVEEFGGATNCFGGHAWTRALVQDQWIEIDAAFKGAGLGGFGAGHITLATGNGEPGDFFSLLSSLGQFKIDRVKVKKKKK